MLSSSYPKNIMPRQRTYRSVDWIGGSLIGILALVLMCLTPLLVYLSWNVMQLGPAMGFQPLDFWPLIGLSFFLACGFILRFFYLLLGFTLLPMLLPVGSAAIHMPELTFKNFIAITLLLLCCSSGSSSSSSSSSS